MPALPSALVLCLPAAETVNCGEVYMFFDECCAVWWDAVARQRCEKGVWVYLVECFLPVEQDGVK